MLGTSHSSTEDNAKVFNVKETALRQWECRVGALL